MQNDILGIDCGDVIIYTLGSKVPGAFETIRELMAAKRFKEIHIVSKVLPTTLVYFAVRLALHGFWKYTGIPRENLHFCARYEDKEKICASLGVTHFVDDRLQVLRALTSVPNRYLFRDQGAPRAWEIRKYGPLPASIAPVHSWDELRRIFLTG